MKKLAQGFYYSFKQDPKETLLIQKTRTVMDQIIRLNLEDRQLSLNTFGNGQQNVTFLKDFGKKFLTNFSWPLQCVFEKIKKLAQGNDYSFNSHYKETLLIRNNHIMMH